MESPIKLPALGQDVKLGMLYDAKTLSLFAGVSLWADAVVNQVQETIPDKVQHAEYKVSTSLDEARKIAGLDVEGSLSLDLGMVKATGSAKYLSNDKTSTFEARVDASCTVMRRTRRIPQETLTSIPYENRLDDPRFTHFVAEVEEGGTATLTFVQTCDSAEQMRQVQGMLKVSVVSLPISGNAEVDYKTDETSTAETLRVTYSGAIVERVSNMEDARRVAREMPEKLAQQMNTLSFVLLPVSVLRNSVRRQIRELDAVLVEKTAAALRDGDDVRLELKCLRQRAADNGRFPVIQRQISRFVDAFATVSTQFSQIARRLLPELRDGTTDYNVTNDELSDAVALYEQRTRFASEFVEKKHDEAGKLGATIEELLADGFEDYVSSEAKSLISKQLRLVISFSGAGVNLEEHPLQKCVESLEVRSHIGSGKSTGSADAGSDYDDDEDEDEQNLEWFEDDGKVELITASCAKLRDLRTRLRAWGSTAPNVTFGVDNISKACPPGKKKRVPTRMGDILLANQGKTVIVTNHIPGVLMEQENPFAPTVSDMSTNTMTVQIPWSIRGSKAEQVLPTTSIVVNWRAVPNTIKDGVFPRATQNEISREVELLAGERVGSECLTELKPDCDYEIQICFQTAVGPSAWSAPRKVRTVKPPSVASTIIAFYNTRSGDLSSASGIGSKPWEMCDESNTLYVGHKVVSEHKCKDSRFLDEVAVRIVDVAPQFCPDITPADITDDENTKILVFVGATGHGKSTQINALIAYLLGSELNERRLMIIDDRGANQALSVTKYITCYRIRPLTDIFNSKTLLIVDTPGYGDTGNENVMGYHRDQFVTAAMNVLFGAVQHVNSVVFTCRANETRKGTLDPVSTYVFQLFAKNASSCLRTIYTFSDVGTPQAQVPLKKLGWPVENGEVEVNNAAFHITYTDANAAKLLDWWVLSMKGQHRVLTALMSMPSIPTNTSKQVTTDRLQLESNCTFVHAQIMKTVSDARDLIASLDALVNALNAKLGELVKVTTSEIVTVPVEKGKATTLCRKCQKTCHEVCNFIHDADKHKCIAMSGEHCRVCHCHWQDHSNATFWLKAVVTNKMVIPEEIINTWNNHNNTLEGSLISAMDKYMKLQKTLQENILYLSELTEKLTNTALRHNPEALLNYVETLIQTALAQGLQPEYVVELITAKNMLTLAAAIKKNGAAGTMRVPNTVANVMKALRMELERRMKLHAIQRLAEEKKQCDLYNNLRKLLPPCLKVKAPELQRKMSWTMSRSDTNYAENLVAIVGLVKLLLSDGNGVAALAIESSNEATAA